MVSAGFEAVAEPARAPREREPILATQDLRRSFEGVQAVAGVSISVSPSTVTGLIGPNGAGKSTLLSALSGTISPTAGRIIYQGRDVTHLPTHRRARAGLVRTFQLSSEFKQMTVLENLLTAVPGNPGDSLFGAIARRASWRRFDQVALARAGALLERFRLTEHADTYAGDLSGGQRRLVEIMRALMTAPKVLLLDEPMAGVHPRLAAEIGEHLLGLKAEGTTIVMVEHELGIVGRFCDPVIVMAEGKVLAEGTMAQLRQHPEVVEAYLNG